MTAFESLRRSVFHIENASCMTNIPTVTQTILFRHRFTFSSSAVEKRSLITHMMRNITAIPMKKFLIEKAILIKAFDIPTPHDSPARKKNSWIGDMKSSRTEFEFPVVPILVLRTLSSLSVSAQSDTEWRRTKNERKTRERNFIWDDLDILYSTDSREKCNLMQNVQLTKYILSEKIFYKTERESTIQLIIKKSICDISLFQILLRL